MEFMNPTPRSRHYPRWMIGKPLLYSSAALASLGDALFGYGQGIIAAAQVQPSFILRMYGSDATLEDIQAGRAGVDVFTQAIVVACLNLTALVASYASAYICDLLGRRMCIRIGGLLYLLSSLIQIFMPNLATLIVGRCIQGLGLGMLSMTVPIYQCEIAPGHERGLFVSIEYLCLNSGYALSAWVGYAFFYEQPREISWRGPYVVQAGLATLLILWTFVLPETPRWLLKNGFHEEGLAVLADLHSGGNIQDSAVLATYTSILETIALETHLGKASWSELFKQYARRTVIGITCQLFAQFNGINAILYFLPENLTRAGFDIGRSLLYSGACAVVYCAGTIPTLLWVDSWGRKRFLLAGSVGLAGALILVGALQIWSEKMPIGGDGGKRVGVANGIFAGVCVYLFIFGATWGPIPWLLGAEIFPLRARAKGMALSTSVNWISNFIIAFITPPLFGALGGGYYFLLAGFAVVSGVVVLFVYRETAGRTLEELGEVFGDGGIQGGGGVEAGECEPMQEVEGGNILEVGGAAGVASFGGSSEVTLPVPEVEVDGEEKNE